VRCAVIAALLLAAPFPASAASLPVADKLFALVPSRDCDITRMRPRIEAAAREASRDRRTARVSIDWPADAARNLDLMGRPSPFAAALEVTAGQPALAGIAGRLQHALGTSCAVQYYLVHERRLMITPRTWLLGQPAPASKTLVTLNRKAGVSFETFDHEWAVTHAVLAMGWRKARGGDGHYVQSLVVGTLGSGTPPLDGIGESEGPGGAPSQQEREARMKTAVHAATFQDQQNSAMFVAREVILKD